MPPKLLQTLKGRQPKTSSQYEEEIRKQHKKIRKIERLLIKNPKHERLQKTYKRKQDAQKRRVQKWAERCKPVVQVANNEGLPWRSEEMPYGDGITFLETRPMLLKRKTGIKQVGDYICFISGPNVWYPKVIDRKTLEDLEQTLVDEENRDRFFKEIETFNNDPRFKDITDKKLEVHAETSRYSFLTNIAPYIAWCKFCDNCKKIVDYENNEVKVTYLCIRLEDRVFNKKPDDTCTFFVERKRTDTEIKSLIKKKRTVLSQLKKAGVEVCWQGSRFEATQAYPVDILEWLKGNYINILNLDQSCYDDLKYLKEKKARLEAELKAVNGSLQALEAL